MALSVEERIAALEAKAEAVAPTDTMAEAGRKVLLTELIKMLQHEAGSRTGNDVEDVHDMRVAIRRMRSAFRLLKPYYKAKDVRPYTEALKRLGETLGDVRDLDVLIDNLRAFQLTLDADSQADLQTTIDALDERRTAAREDLIATFDSKPYRRFLKAFSEFVTTPIEKKLSDEVVPSEVRHLLPSLIYDRLAAVRAYEDRLDDADDTRLHALRIEFKRLRYTVSLFDAVLGKSISDFMDELKVVQDTLGHLNDGATARASLDALLDGNDDHHSDALNAYLNHLDADHDKLIAEFKTHWERFNSRKVQEKLSKAVLSLR
ncbi:MAG: CHAD domain-containing protein [Anaerolineae bacterium]|nr:CHAD domain-containing protein [Anaerolineae bacterium]